MIEYLIEIASLCVGWLPSPLDLAAMALIAITVIVVIIRIIVAVIDVIPFW